MDRRKEGDHGAVSLRVTLQREREGMAIHDTGAGGEQSLKVSGGMQGSEGCTQYHAWP